VIDEEILWGAIKLLNQYSMIDVAQGEINIHRLVQQVIRLELQDQSKEEKILAKALELINNTDVEGNESHFISIWDYGCLYV